MSRADYKRHGKFNTDAETQRIYEGQRGYQEAFGDYVQYYELNPELSEFDPVYGEAINNGRVYRDPITLPCQHVTHVAGANDQGEYGFYFNDDLVFSVPWKLWLEADLVFPKTDRSLYMRDRCYYDGMLFRVTKLEPVGKVQKRPTVMSVEATEVKADECVDDPTMLALVSNPND